MTDNTLAVFNRSTALLVSESEDEIKQVARKLMRMTPGGNRLTTDQATDLAVYSFITQLNPFNNECYYMDKVGPVPGIVGYRVKAAAWLRSTSPNAPAPRTQEEYRPATTEEADFDPDKGDIAWVCILSDSVSTASWEKRRLELMRSYREMGAEFHEAYELAAKDAGNKPCWQAVGVVKADEHFSGNVWRNNQKVENEYKPEMWDRNERAKKRAAKGCYRKGFPEVNIPDAEEGEIYDAEVREVKDNIALSLNSTTAEPAHTEADNMKALGFDTEPAKPEPIQAAAPEPAKDAPAVTTLTIELAEAELSREGDRYGEMASEDLQHRAFGLAKVAPNKRSPIQQFKLDCIDLIMKEREKGRPVQVAQPLEGQETLI